MTVDVFIDTNIIDRVLDLDTEKPENEQYEEDRKYLSKIVEEYVKKDLVRFFVNTSVKQEIEKTPCDEKREKLLEQFEKFEFTSFNTTKFPFSFPGHFPKDKEADALTNIQKNISDFKGFDGKIFLDALSNSKINILLTANIKDFKQNTVEKSLSQKELNENLAIFTPKELFEYLNDKFQ